MKYLLVRNQESRDDKYNIINRSLTEIIHASSYQEAIERLFKINKLEQFSIYCKNMLIENGSEALNGLKWKYKDLLEELPKFNEYSSYEKWIDKSISLYEINESMNITDRVKKIRENFIDSISKVEIEVKEEQDKKLYLELKKRFENA